MSWGIVLTCPILSVLMEIIPPIIKQLNPLAPRKKEFNDWE